MVTRKMLALARRVLPVSRLTRRIPVEVWSWEGEDILVHKIMSDVFGVAQGFYVDLGAHHPFNMSNTALLYARGWQGINVDAEPGSMEAFRKYRPRDINLEVALAADPGRRVFTRFTDPLLNGFVPDSTVSYHRSRGADAVEQIEVDCMPLNTLLEKHAAGRHIDLMNIDVEGLDYEILASLDMRRWRPTAILTEVLGCAFVDDVMANPAHALMEERG